MITSDISNFSIYLSIYLFNFCCDIRVIDVGLRNLFMGPDQSIPGKPGLLFVDMEKELVTDRFYFPEDVVSSSSSFLNDLVVDETREIAYLTDADGTGSLITFDYQTRQSRRYSGASTQNEADYVMVIDDVNYGTRIFTTPVDGIAMSQDCDYIYYCAVQGTHLYRVPSLLLRDFSGAYQETIDAAVVNLGSKPPSDGIMMWGDALYFGSLSESTFYGLNMSDNSSEANTTAEAVSIPADPVAMQWVCLSDCMYVCMYPVAMQWKCMYACIYICIIN